MKIPRVLAINSSPRADRGNTCLILEPFLEGMRAEGAIADMYYSKDLNVGACRSDLHCWLGEPGKCVIDDDMKRLQQKFVNADIWVIASPLYVDGLSGEMKIILERALLPMAIPYMEVREGVCRHPLRNKVEDGKVALVSTCGYWELEHFKPMVSHVRAISMNAGREFAGALLRPHAGVLKPLVDSGGAEEVVKAAYEAGRELIRDGRISDETAATVSKELTSLEQYIELVNDEFRKVLED